MLFGKFYSDSIRVFTEGTYSLLSNFQLYVKRRFFLIYYSNTFLNVTNSSGYSLISREMIKFLEFSRNSLPVEDTTFANIDTLTLAYLKIKIYSRLILLDYH